MRRDGAGTLHYAPLQNFYKFCKVRYINMVTLSALQKQHRDGDDRASLRGIVGGATAILIKPGTP